MAATTYTIPSLDLNSYVRLDEVACEKGSETYTFGMLIPNWDFTGKLSKHNEFNALIAKIRTEGQVNPSDASNDATQPITSVAKDLTDTEVLFPELKAWIKEQIAGFYDIVLKKTVDGNVEVLTQVNTGDEAFDFTFELHWSHAYVVRGIISRFAEYFEAP